MAFENPSDVVTQGPGTDLPPPRAVPDTRRAASRRSAATSFPRSKRILDVVVAGVLLVVSAPLMLVIALLVRRDGGPVLFVQARLGERGRTFQVLKFRSMAVDAEQRLRNEPELHARYVAGGFKLPADRDPRVTRLGRFLRETSLDELPQLLNVLRGDMSMVGPRPIVSAELDEYTRRGAAAAYLACRPGLTGLWQVSGRSVLSYDRRVSLDVDYLAHRSFFGDVGILLRTIIVVLRRVGAH